MAKYRKKPVIIEAIRFDGSDKSILDIMHLQSSDFSSAVSKQVNITNGGKTLLIHTLEGVMEATLGDWIIQGVSRELYPCKSDIFEKTYEKVEDNG